MAELGGDAASSAYQSVLRWVIESTVTEEAPALEDERGSAAAGGGGGGVPRAMGLSEEDKKFLKGAVEEMTMDEAKRLERIGGLLKEAQEGTLEDDGTVSVLEELQDRCENLDNAHVLHAVGAMMPLITLCRRRDRVGDVAMSAMSQSVQNYPPVQHLALEHGALAACLEGEGDLRPAQMSAISSLVRDHEQSQADLIKAEFSTRISNSLKAADSKLAARIAFFLRHVLQGPCKAEWCLQLGPAFVHTALERLAQAQTRAAADTDDVEPLGVEEHLLVALSFLLRIAIEAKLRKSDTTEPILELAPKILEVATTTKTRVQELEGEAKEAAEDNLKAANSLLSLQKLLN